MRTGLPTALFAFCMGGLWWIRRQIEGPSGRGRHEYDERETAIARRALAAGHRNRKVMNLMTYGPYEEPRGTYCPSVMF